MSLDANAIHSHPLGKQSIFGMPYHGLVQGGALTLPNTAVMVYPQPNDDWPDTAGSTHLVQVPGTPAVSRSTAQAAADDAAGFQWRDVAMLSGGQQQLYGHNLTGWIYVDPDGVRWHMSFSPMLVSVTYDFTAAVSFTLNAIRFGEIGGAFEAYSYDLSLTDWGQSAGAQEGFPASGGGYESITAGRLLVDSIYRDGSKVALMVHHRRLAGAAGTSDTTVDLMVRHPLGWLQLALSGPGASLTATLSVLKSRADVVTITTQSVSAMPSVTSFPALIGSAPTIEAAVGLRTFDFNFSRLLSARADEASGGWKWVSYRVRHQGSSAASMGSAGAKYTSVSTLTADLDLSIELDGSSQMTYSIHSERTSSTDFEYLSTPDGLGNTFYVTAQGSSADTNIDGSVTSETTGAGSPDGYAGLTSLPITLMSAVGSQYNGTSMGNFIFRSAWRLSLDNLPLYGITLGTPRFDVCRYSGQVFGFRAHINATESRHSKQVSPVGATTSGTTRTFSATERLYSSWCPHTGQVAALSTTPVCWV